MKVLVTGGGGLVGSAVVADLVAHGHTVTTLELGDIPRHDGVRVVRGDARDPAVVASAVDDGDGAVDGVAHLAAIADPGGAPPQELFANNTQATFNVLWTAAAAGVRRLVIASSVNAIGLPLNPHRPLPGRFPIDEDTVADIADAYSLSKSVDEHTLRAVCRRFGCSGVALRLPLVLSADNAAALRDWRAGRVGEGAGEGWGWLDVRDGAEAFRLALTATYDGAHVVQLAAADTMIDVPTDDLLRRYAPGVPSPHFEGCQAPIDTARAAALFGFSPRQRAPGAG